MAKTKKAKVSARKKVHFLPPSSPYRLPITLLIAISISFFMLLMGYIIYSAHPSSDTEYTARSTERSVRKEGFIEKVRAQDFLKPRATATPIPAGYCLTVPILMYHHVQPLAEAAKLGHEQLTVDRDVFESQLAYLHDRKYTTITLDSLVEAIKNHTTVPENSIVLTFDDGYRDMYTYVFPLLKQYNMNGSFMISTGLLENTDYMTWANVIEMSKDSHVTLYNHTWSHAALGQISKEKIDFELTTSTTDFVNQLGHMSTVMAYPYGSYSTDAISVLKSHGFTAAVTTEPGRVQCDTYLMTLKRDHVGNAPLSSYGL